MISEELFEELATEMEELFFGLTLPEAG